MLNAKNEGTTLKFYLKANHFIITVCSVESVVNTFERISDHLASGISRNAALRRENKQLTSIRRVEAIYHLKLIRPTKWDEVKL